jgi:hypothetical protein
MYFHYLKIYTTILLRVYIVDLTHQENKKEEERKKRRRLSLPLPLP